MGIALLNRDDASSAMQESPYVEEPIVSSFMLLIYGVRLVREILSWFLLLFIPLICLLYMKRRNLVIRTMGKATTLELMASFDVHCVILFARHLILIFLGNFYYFSWI